eukprot:COSAG04_NODE_10951_length_741_cov_2.422118_1_plen_150_part_10
MSNIPCIVRIDPPADNQVSPAKKKTEPEPEPEACEPEPEPESSGACQRYQVDMSAAVFGNCKCGFPKADHSASALDSSPRGRLASQWQAAADGVEEKVPYPGLDLTCESSLGPLLSFRLQAARLPSSPVALTQTRRRPWTGSSGRRRGMA